MSQRVLFVDDLKSSGIANPEACGIPRRHSYHATVARSFWWQRHLTAKEVTEPEETATCSRGVRVEVDGSSWWRIRCLPPVYAPLRLIFRDRRMDRTRKFTKPLLYRLSYVGEERRW